MTREAGTHLEAWLSAPPPERLDAADARAHLEHAGRCEPCAAALARHPDHAALLLEASSPPAALDERFLAELASEERALREAARELLRRLPRSAVALLRTGPPVPAAVVPGDPPELLRAGVALSEVALALESALGDRPGASLAVAKGSRDVEAGGRRIPARHLEARIARAAGVDAKVAAALWTHALALLAGDGAGLPGLVAARARGGRLVVEREPDGAAAAGGAGGWAGSAPAGDPHPGPMLQASRARAARAAARPAQALALERPRPRRKPRA